MSLCDRCYHPGHCCKRIPLNTVFSLSGDIKEQLLNLEKDNPNEGPLSSFIPIEVDKLQSTPEQLEAGYGRYLFSCTNLLPSGRCGNYENRPALCRRYQPQRDKLCVFFGIHEDIIDGL